MRRLLKLKFKKQTYQIQAVDAVQNCFQGQLHTVRLGDQINPGSVPYSFP